MDKVLNRNGNGGKGVDGRVGSVRPRNSGSSFLKEGQLSATSLIFFFSVSSYSQAQAPVYKDNVETKRPRLSGEVFLKTAKIS